MAKKGLKKSTGAEDLESLSGETLRSDKADLAEAVQYHINLDELESINKNIRTSRIDSKDALMELAERSGSDDIRNFAEVCGICRETGGDMQKVISEAAANIADKLQSRSAFHKKIWDFTPFFTFFRIDSTLWHPFSVRIPVQGRLFRVQAQRNDP